MGLRLEVVRLKVRVSFGGGCLLVVDFEVLEVCDWSSVKGCQVCTSKATQRKAKKSKAAKYFRTSKV